ncbi:unnamed protein product [Debaryomyces tyrocola]|nr:unnamed protein product [Debaryomyces tyrocola]
MYMINNGKIADADNSVEAYTSTYISYLTRLYNKIIILFAPKVTCDNNQIPNSIIEAVALEAPKNILRNAFQIKDEVIMNISLIPWSIALGIAVSLKKKANYLLTTGICDSTEHDCGSDLHNYIAESSKKWWVVDRLVN